MPLPLIVPLAIGAGQAIAQFAQARKQNKEAKKALSYRNPYVDQAAKEAKIQANATRYPGQDIDEANVRQGVADTFSNVSRATRSSGDLVNTAAKLNNSQQRAFQDIAKQGQIFRQSATDKYRQMLMQQAGVMDANRQYSEALKGSAQQNKYNALNSILGGAAAGLSWADFGGGGTPKVGTGAAAGAGATARAATSGAMKNRMQMNWGYMNPNQYNNGWWTPGTYSNPY